MAELAYQVYVWCVPIVALLVALGSVSTKDPDLLKAGLAVFGHTAAIWAYLALFDTSGQPWIFYVISLSICAYIITAKPAGIMSGIIGGVILFGIATTGALGLYQLFNGFSAFADWAIWICIFAMACLNLLALTGWSCGNIGRRLAFRRSGFPDRTSKAGAAR
jgi:hypothetical protein